MKQNLHLFEWKGPQLLTGVILAAWGWGGTGAASPGQTHTLQILQTAQLCCNSIILHKCIHYRLKEKQGSEEQRGSFPWAK